jgi:hypothetical protein
MLDADDIGPKILSAINKSTTDVAALTFDPNQSAVMLQSQISALAGAMTVTCPENVALLSDLTPKQKDPWIVSRPIALYIVYSEASDIIARQAVAMKDWLCMWCDIHAEQVVLCSSPDDQHSVGDASETDCAGIATDVDTVILLQSEAVLSEPRCLARLYIASKAKVPIVPVNLTSSNPANAELLWNFETAKPAMLHLDTGLDAHTAAMVAAGTSGASTAEVGTVLSRVIPNIISKPLEIDGASSQFEAQMLDIELTLRREMSADGKAIAINQPIDAATRRGSTVTRNAAEGVPRVRKQARAQTEAPPR